MSSEFRPEPQDGFDFCPLATYSCEYEDYLFSIESSEGWFFGLDIAKESESLVDCYDI